VVGDGKGRHAEIGGAGDDLVDTTGAVAEGEVRVQVEVDEAHGRVCDRDSRATMNLRSVMAAGGGC
jgi:hypothetical protein